MKSEIKNLKKVAERILKAIKNKEKIILYGDADLDGISSVIILKDTILNLGGKVAACYFPDREKEGYGLNESALKKLAELTPALLITLDCGIGNFEEVKLAKKMGFEVIIIDHHEILDKMPPASIVVDPKQKGDKYPFKELANVGITYKLSRILLGKKISQNLKISFLELTALATLADMMPEEEDNKVFIDEGIYSLERSLRPGIRAFFEMEPFKNYSGLRHKISKIISILNVRDIDSGLPACFRILTCSSQKKAEKIIKRLLEKSEIKRQKVREIIEEVKKRVLEKPEGPIIFEGDKNWKVTILSAAASRICKKYGKPVFLYQLGKEESQGAVRAFSEYNGVKAMMNCSQLLETYGGHPRAAGFRIKNQDLEKFERCLTKYFKKIRQEQTKS